jgi:hypothetical protein
MLVMFAAGVNSTMRADCELLLVMMVRVCHAVSVIQYQATITYSRISISGRGKYKRKDPTYRLIC